MYRKRIVRTCSLADGSSNWSLLQETLSVVTTYLEDIENTVGTYILSITKSIFVSREKKRKGRTRGQSRAYMRPVSRVIKFRVDTAQKKEIVRTNKHRIDGRSGILWKELPAEIGLISRRNWDGRTLPWRSRAATYRDTYLVARICVCTCPVTSSWPVRRAHTEGPWSRANLEFGLSGISFSAYVRACLPIENAREYTCEDNASL